MKRKLQLYVWKGFAPDWTDGLAFAIASSEDEARQLVIDDYGCGPDGPSAGWGDLTVLPLTKKFAAQVGGGS